MKVLLKNTITRNGKVVARKGDILPEKKAVAKKIRPCYYTVLDSKNTPYTYDEVVVIVNAYLENDNRVAVMNHFFEVFPNTTHTPDSVMATACQLENIDNTKPNGVYHLTQLVVEVATAIAPTRFG